MFRLLSLSFLVATSIFFLRCKEDKTTSSSFISFDKYSEKIKVAMDLSFPPFQSIGKDGKPEGIYVDLVYELGNFLKKNIEIFHVKWGSTMSGVRSGLYDLVTFSSVTAEREEIVDFSMPYMEMSLDLLIRRGIEFESANDFNDPKFRVAVHQGTIAEEVALRYFPKAQLIRLVDTDTAVFDVVQGKSDVVLHHSLAIYEYAKKYSDRVVPYYCSLEKVFKAFLVRKSQDKVFLSEINRFLEHYQSSGKMKLLDNKYFGNIRAEFEKNNWVFGIDFY